MTEAFHIPNISVKMKNKAPNSGIACNQASPDHLSWVSHWAQLSGRLCAVDFVLEDRKLTRAQEMCSKQVARFWKALLKEFLDFEYSKLSYYFPSL